MKINSFFLNKILVISIPIFVALLSASKSFGTSIFDMFNHDSHNAIFESAKVDCKLCHAKDKDYNRKRVNLQGCHRCHNNPAAEVPGPNDCTMCHNSSLDTIKPRNHNGSWLRAHRSIAAQDDRRCATCHTSFFCTDCHQQRDTVRQTMHPRNFLMTHSIEARANPARCDACHISQFCTKCHTFRSLP